MGCCCCCYCWRGEISWIEDAWQLIPRIPTSGLHMTREHPAATMIIPLCSVGRVPAQSSFRLGLVAFRNRIFFSRKSMRGGEAEDVLSAASIHPSIHHIIRHICNIKRTVTYCNGAAAGGAYARTEPYGFSRAFACRSLTERQTLNFGYVPLRCVHGLPPEARRGWCR